MMLLLSFGIGVGIGIGIDYRINAHFIGDPIPIAIPTPKIFYNADFDIASL